MSQVDVESVDRKESTLSQKENDMKLGAFLAMAGRIRQPALRGRVLRMMAARREVDPKTTVIPPATTVVDSVPKEHIQSLGDVVGRVLADETSSVRTDAGCALSARGGDAPVDAPAEGSYAR